MQFMIGNMKQNTVYVTGTSSIHSHNRRLDADAEPGTVEETAQEITKAGGVGIPVICNHANDQQVRELFQTIKKDHDGRIDILVNNAFSYPPGGTKGFQQKFWHDTNATIWDSVHNVGFRSHYVASCCAVPMMIQQQQLQQKQQQQQSSSSVLLPRPLIVMIGSFGGVCYLFHVSYGVAKAGVDRMAKDMAVELANENISVVSLWPGVVATERNIRSIETDDWYFGVSPDIVESPNLTGKVIVELALDSNNMKKSGTYQVVAELAKSYQLHKNHLDGKASSPLPPSIRSLRYLLPVGLKDKKIPSWLIPDWKLPFWVMAQRPPPPKP